MDCLHRWRQWIRPVVITIYVILLTIALPLCIWDLNRVHKEVHVQAWFVGGIFVMMSLPISLWGILQHLVYYTQPVLQRHIIRILWMVPVYAANAWFALRFPFAAIYLDTVRECYEAYVIYNFTSFLMHYLRMEHPHFDIVLEGKPQVKHIIPFCLLPPWPMGRTFIQRCKHGVLQYTVVRPATTVIALICELSGVYDEGDFNFTSAWSYLVIVNNISQIWAMYCLILFYKAAKEELAHIRPLAKFLCVKAVVFMSFWQAVVIAALDKLGAIPHQDNWIIYKSDKEVALGIQDFCICIEMFIAAIAHYYSFSHKPFMNMAADQTNCCESFLSMWDVRDVRDDVIEHARYLGKGVHDRLYGRYKKGVSETSPLLGDSNVNNHSINSQTQVTKPQTANEEQPQMPEKDWEVSSIDQIHDSFVNKSTSASMNNYLEFSNSSELSNHRQNLVTMDTEPLGQSGDLGQGHQLNEGDASGQGHMLSKSDLQGQTDVLKTGQSNTVEHEVLVHCTSDEMPSVSEDTDKGSNIC